MWTRLLQKFRCSHQLMLLNARTFPLNVEDYISILLKSLTIKTLSSLLQHLKTRITLFDYLNIY